MIYVYKEYEMKTNIVQEQWLQLKMKFLLGYNIEIVQHTVHQYNLQWWLQHISNNRNSQWYFYNQYATLSQPTNLTYQEGHTSW